MNELEYIYFTLFEIIEALNDLDYDYFAPTFCMIAEEYCKAHHLDVKDFMQDATTMVYQVNNELGTY